MKSWAILPALALGIVSHAVPAQDRLEELSMERISPRGLFVPEAGKAYLLVESRNRRPLITFVRAGSATPFAASGYIEIPRENRLANEGDVSLWLYEIPAGEYFVSNITWLYTPNDIDCACMGSVSFAVEPGTVTAVRVETAVLDRNGDTVAIGNRLNEVPRGRSETDHFAFRAIEVGHPTSDLWRTKIAAGGVTMAQFTPVADLPNWRAAIPTRVTAMDGVFGYDAQGGQIDLRAGR
ncbi:hypothetical protein [Aurantiacibacter spongiae]|uniref:Uncharacterized protein n=1 Tax=Aurantiacibacter spongiae TaxID=2488860 RepID=A0A3N5CUI8_9SPHN|nr:hypothetical protein [Aurantiacibacter spongiae]RPF71996.1 hypothetical protein EG799_10515 [Aurantiacibacter spongiae]